MLTLIDKDLAGIDPYDPRLKSSNEQKYLENVCAIVGILL